ncbi:MAG: alpha/beta fold hydrolase [Alistipes sp.]|nr:alpha/beta fold hydrolase [Alistipes sp.]
MVYIIVLMVLITVVAVGFALPAVKMHKMLDRRSEGEPYDPTEFDVESSVVALESVDGVSLTAYEVVVESPKGVVICLGGIHSATITNWYGHSKLFADNGFASVLLDVRSHGRSDGEKIYAATREWMDVDAAVEYIRSKELYNGVPIIAMGLSMGAATAVVATGRNENIDALIALSAYSDWAYNFDLNVEQIVSKFVAKMLSPFVAVVTRLRFGNMVTITPRNEIKKLGNRPALLVQSVGDKLVPYGNFVELVAAAPQVQRWVLKGDNHCIIDDFVHPQNSEQYCKRIIEFLNSVAR